MSEKFLVIGPAWIGDAVMSQCLLKLLKQKPNVTIDVLAPAWTFSLLKCMPEISNVIEMPISHGEFKLRQRLQIGKSLRKNNYDTAIVLPNSFKSALIPWWANIPKRIGWLGEWRYFLLNDIRYLDKKRYPLMIEQYMALALDKDAALPEKYPYPEFIVAKESQAKTLMNLNLIQSGKPVLALGPGGAFGSSKRWPPEHFAAVANEKLNAGWDVWIFGSKQDKPITDIIMQMTEQRCSDFSGRTELADTIDLVGLSSGVVTNDSGLMHIAAALQKPIIAIYGSTSPKFTPPLSAKANILKLNLDCQPCFERECPLGHHKCMRDLSPNEVITATSGWK